MTQRIRITREIGIPDPLKIERYRRAPSLGPRILFFSGGTALKRVAKDLIHYTHNSIHIITAFDSGGSSASLRKAFDMIAVGDLRNRLMALADQLVTGNPAIYTLFAYRFSHTESNEVLHQRLANMLEGNDPLLDPIRGPMRTLICNHLRYFHQAMPAGFDLRGANIGNLILVGGYINNQFDIEPALFLFERLAEVRGIVKPVSSKNLHLVAELADGSLIVGQHLLTGKETAPIQSTVERVWLTDNPRCPEPVDVTPDEGVRKLIRQADLICYPMGSFYSSLVANLIPGEIGRDIAGNDCLKVYIPNTCPDPEQIGLSGHQTVLRILDYLNPNYDISTNSLLNYIVVDTKNAHYPFPLDLERIKGMNIGVIDTELVTPESAPFVDPMALNRVLLSLT